MLYDRRIHIHAHPLPPIIVLPAARRAALRALTAPAPSSRRSGRSLIVNPSGRSLLLACRPCPWRHAPAPDRGMIASGKNEGAFLHETSSSSGGEEEEEEEEAEGPHRAGAGGQVLGRAEMIVEAERRSVERKAEWARVAATSRAWRDLPAR
eukprot:COSAG01_NODE_13403_length_1590_cov_23.262240_2_plen_152_part_00